MQKDLMVYNALFNLGSLALVPGSVSNAKNVFNHRQVSVVKKVINVCNIFNAK